MTQLSNMSTIKLLLERHGFRFSKSLGQNFLINPSVCPRMAEESGVTGETNILEIGPGIGVLTCELASRGRKVVSIELDKRLLPVLKETLAAHDNVTVVQGDALKVDLQALIKEEFSGEPVSVCANLPYYITSPVIMRLLEERLPLESITVMVQKEAAERICAEPGTRASGAISLAVNYYAEPRILFPVSRGSFMPSPKVDSAVIRLDVRKKPPVELESEKRFFQLIAAAFGQRRKTVCNAVSAGLSLPKERVLAALERADLDLMVRAERLTLVQFSALDRALSEE